MPHANKKQTNKNKTNKQNAPLHDVERRARERRLGDDVTPTPGQYSAHCLDDVGRSDHFDVVYWLH
jgi:hypothetical protein